MAMSAVITFAIPVSICKQTNVTCGGENEMTLFKQGPCCKKSVLSISHSVEPTEE